MRSINALSLTTEVNTWLASSRYPRILHVFERACNLINEHRDVLSIVTSQIGNGPFNIVVEDDVLFSDRLSRESLISICSHQLHFGDLIIDAVDAKLWNPRPDWEVLHARRDYITELLLTNHQKCGLDMPFTKTTQGYSTTTFNPNLPITNYKFSNSLVSSIATADLSSSLTAVKKLAGLGIGLTPSGDDFIMGAILAAWIIHPPDVVTVLAEEITNIAAPLTTSLSAAWLRSAGRGEAGILWHEFFKAVLATENIELPITKLLSVGETSGADALAGFFSVISTFNERIPSAVTNCAF
ncbi:MAG: DUF2877 domain-containing protein [Chloroflexota bacterium]